MPISWCPTDVPAVAVEQMRVLASMITTTVVAARIIGTDVDKIQMSVAPASSPAPAAVEEVVKREVGDDPERYLPIMLRLQALIEVLEDHRITKFVGYNVNVVTSAICEVAATMRLDALSGFNANRFFRMLAAELAGNKSS